MTNGKDSPNPEILPPETETETLPGNFLTQFRAEVDQQVATARHYPRSIAAFRRKVLELATVDEATAAACWYTLPRAGKKIEGPSIRFAEIVAAAYGNLRVGARVTGVEKEVVRCQGVCHDLENNVAVSIEITRRITRKDGSRYDEDMIGVTSNAGNAIALRNAVFRVIPRALYAGLLDKVRQVALGDERTLVETRRMVMAYFRGLNITDKQVLALLGRKGIEDITLEDVGDLRGIATAIKDGDTTAEEAFKTDRAAPSTGSIPVEAMRPGKPAEHTPPDAPQTPAESPREKLERLFRGTTAQKDVLEGLMFMAGLARPEDNDDPKKVDKFETLLLQEEAKGRRGVC